jgi:hypothetical protein
MRLPNRRRPIENKEKQKNDITKEEKLKNNHKLVFILEIE